MCIKRSPKNRNPQLLTTRGTRLKLTQFRVKTAQLATLDLILFQSADKSWVLIGFVDQDGPVHDVGDLAKFSHFNTTF